jgi:hypothetical protein
LFVLLPFIVFTLLLSLMILKITDWREALLVSMLLWSTILVAITEILSLFENLTFQWLAALWSLVAVSSGFMLYRQLNKKGIGTLFSRFPQVKAHKTPKFSLILLAGVGLIFIFTAFLAIYSAPNNPDSMRYHMSRVAHWIQNTSVAHYPTHELKELYQNPGSEFLITNFQIFSGGDYFANLVQWFSMVGSVIGVSLIAKQFGANARGQIFSSLFCATIPMGMLQAASTQNDYFVSLWLVCFVYFALVIQHEGISTLRTFQLGISLGLAILAKGTAYIYAFPFGIWLLIWGIKNLRLRAWKPITTILTIMLLLNLGHYVRNYLLFTSPLGVPVESETNESFSLALLILSFSKQLSLHADLIGYFQLKSFLPSLTAYVNLAVDILHYILGYDINDPGTMSPKASKFFVSGISTYEDIAGNPLHLLLIFVSILLIAAYPSLRKRQGLLGYTIALISGFLLFCLLFTWSPWRARLHLPVFVMFSPLVGTAFCQVFHNRLINVLGLLILVLSYPWIIDNRLKPMVGQKNIFTESRQEQYFNTRPVLAQPYMEAVEFIKSQGCQEIGIAGDNIWYSYPLWPLLSSNKQELGNENFTIYAVAVDNESASIAESKLETDPCAVLVASKESLEVTALDDPLANTYRVGWSTNLLESQGSIQVLLKR